MNYIIKIGKEVKFKFGGTMKFIITKNERSMIVQFRDFEYDCITRLLDSLNIKYEEI